MIRITNESGLVKRLHWDVEECGKERIVLQAGHFPLFYLPKEVIEAIYYWGQFSTYTLELGCVVGQYAREIGKEVQFVFFVDDHSYEDMSGLNHSQRRSRRNRLYKEKSGENAKLNPEYHMIMDQFGFNEQQVVRHNHGKVKRESCLYFSEKVLRTISQRKIENICAREYTEFIEDPRYFDKTRSHLISFVPNRCMGHICDIALDQEIAGLSASHIFMETMLPLSTREQLYEQARGVSYRRD